MDSFSSVSDGQLAVLGLSVIAVGLIGLVVWILEVIAGWKIFTKAEEAGWKSIIPIYRNYIGYKIAWNTTMFWVTLVLGIAGRLLQQQGGTMATVAGVITIIAFVIYCMYNNKLAKAFGKGTGFTVGLIIFNPIFKLILGFGDAQYQGAQE